MALATTRSLAVGLLILVVLISLTAIVLAVSSGTATADASVDINNPTQTMNADTIRVEASGAVDCASSVAQYSFLKWDLTDAAGKEIKTVQMSLTMWYAELGDATSGAQQLALYQTTDGWNETSVSWNNNMPSLGTQIESKVLPTDDNSVITFESAALLDYVRLQAQGDKVASFALGLTGACTANSAVTVELYSKDHTNVGFKPTLDIRSPTSVALTTLTAEQPTPNWPLYIGLGVLALMVVGLLFYRRRAVSR